MNTSISWNSVPFSVKMSREKSFGLIILAALLAFELFNYSTTEFALSDLLGDLRFSGVRWATILALAFCGMDFAGLARLFTPRQGNRETAEVWYLFGAWLLAAAMNAVLTWWGVTIALLNHETLGSTLISRSTLLQIAPIFVAVMVWIIRVLVIGSFSMAGSSFQNVDRRRKPDSQSASVHFPLSAESSMAMRDLPAQLKDALPGSDRYSRSGGGYIPTRNRNSQAEKPEPVYESIPEHS